MRNRYHKLICQMILSCFIISQTSLAQGSFLGASSTPLSLGGHEEDRSAWAKSLAVAAALGATVALGTNADVGLADNTNPLDVVRDTIAHVKKRGEEDSDGLQATVTADQMVVLEVKDAAIQDVQVAQVAYDPQSGKAVARTEDNEAYFVTPHITHETASQDAYVETVDLKQVETEVLAMESYNQRVYGLDCDEELIILAYDEPEGYITLGTAPEWEQQLQPEGIPLSRVIQRDADDLPPSHNLLMG